MKRDPSGRARYEEIAQDLARRIASGELGEGARVLGRSSLAGTYQVSPETIRRAVAILHERGIVQSVAGSGIRVISAGAAREFLESVRTRTDLEEDARELRALLDERKRLDEKIEAALDRVITQATGAFAARRVEEVPVPPESWVVGKSLGEIRLRSSTGATAVALTRGEQDTFSPPPDLEIVAGDVVTLIGSDEARHQARQLLTATTAPV